MSLKEFVKNRRELPNFGLHGTRTNLDLILTKSLYWGCDNCFYGHYYYCGHNERMLPDKVYEQRLAASISNVGGRLGNIIILVDINQEIKDDNGHPVNLLGRDFTSIEGSGSYYEKTFPVARDPCIYIKDGKRLIEFRELVLTDYDKNLRNDVNYIDAFINKFAYLIYRNIIEVKNSLKEQV